MSADSLGSWVDGVEVVMAGADVDLTKLAAVGGPAAELVCIDGGDVSVVLAASGGATRTFHGVPAGTSLGMQVIRITNSGTTATTFWAGWR